MKKIAMLTCLKANTVCTGAACFQALHERTKSFARYQGEDVWAAAFMRCNGCGSDPLRDEGIREKVERLAKEQISAVHVGVCTKNKDGKRCKNIETIMKMIEAQGISVLDGTH